MRLTDPVAEKIVRECIVSAVGWPNPIPVGAKLNQVGITDADALEALIDQIVNSEQFGVPSVNYRIHPSDLDLSLSKHVWEVRQQVADGAVPA